LGEEESSQPSETVNRGGVTIVKEDSAWKICADLGRPRNVDGKWNIHDCPQDKHIGAGVDPFHLGTRQVLLLELWFVAAEKAHKQTTLILDGRIHQAREMVWVQMVDVWLVILFVAWVINQKSI
jgi:hypothetical protein